MKKQTQNKPNFRKAKMNLTSVLTTDYENKSNWTLGENKANTNPIKPNTKPIKANKMPIQTQYKPNQTQSPNPRFYPKNQASLRQLIFNLFALNGFERFQYEPAQYQHHCHHNYQQQNSMLFRPGKRFGLNLSKQRIVGDVT